MSITFSEGSTCRTKHENKQPQGDRARDGDNLRHDRANRRRALASGSRE